MADETLLDDETLLVRMATGDDMVAVGVFYDRWYPQFTRLATRLTGDAHGGEDVAQDAAIRIIRCAGLYKKGRSARSWILALVYNLSRDWWRKKNVREAASLDETAGDEGSSRAAEIPGREPTAEERSEARERADAVNKSLKKLTLTEREVIILRDYEGLSAPETAHILGISVEKVGSRLHRARKRLGALLQTDWPGLFPSHEL